MKSQMAQEHDGDLFAVLVAQEENLRDIWQLPLIYYRVYFENFYVILSQKYNIFSPCFSHKKNEVEKARC